MIEEILKEIEIDIDSQKTIQDILDAISDKYGNFICDVWRFANSKSISKKETEEYMKNIYQEFDKNEFEKFYNIGLKCADYINIPAVL